MDSLFVAEEKKNHTGIISNFKFVTLIINFATILTLASGINSRMTYPNNHGC